MSRKFSVSVCLGGGDDPCDHYLVEAQDKEEATQILNEQVGLYVSKHASVVINWSTHDTVEWRSAWRFGQVKVLKMIPLPAGIE